MLASTTPCSRVPPGGARRVLPLLLLVSGAVALVYEVAWQRQFALVLGAAAPATAAVLAAYFAGLGLGGWVVGNWMQRWSRPLRAYALLELTVAAGACLVTPLLAAVERGYPWLLATWGGQPAAWMAVRVAVVFAVLALPTLAMGGTLPLLGQWMDRGRRQLGQTAGWLYVANTVGAGAGALAVPFVLLPWLGLAGAGRVGVAGNLILAGVAWWLDARSGDVPATVGEERTVAGREAAAWPGARVTGLALVSGAVTFALQVLWNRAFAQVHENSVYSFAVIVAVVILALALGAQAARVVLRRGWTPRRTIAVAWSVAGGWIAVSPWVFYGATGGLGYLSAGSGGWEQAGRLGGLAALVVGPGLALAGMALPALMEEVGQTAGAAPGRALGRLLAVNLAGSVAGALAAGFWLPAWLGLWAALGLCGIVLLVAGLAQRDGWSGRRGAGLMAAGAAALGAVVLGAPPRVRVAADGGERLLALSEGAQGIVAVVERSGSRRLKLNNHYALGGTAATGDERMQAHLPLLLHPAPRRVAFLGLGTGITAGGARFHPVERVTVMELVPEVIAAARTWFAEANAGVLADARTRIVPDDARHFLRGSGERFEVIVGDLVVPWRQGEGALFTLEQFRAARAALAPGGRFVQWLPLFQLGETEVTILVRTFLAVFPTAEVWRGDFSPTEPAIMLVGRAGPGDGPGTSEAETVAARLAAMRPDPDNPHLRTPASVWLHWVGTVRAEELPAAETRINREDLPWIELLGPLRPDGEAGAVWFTGRRLQAWLAGIRQRSAADCAALPPEAAAGAQAGPWLAEFALCLSEGNAAGAEAAQAQLRSLLPRETYRSLFPE